MAVSKRTGQGSLTFSTNTVKTKRTSRKAKPTTKPDKKSILKGAYSTTTSTISKQRLLEDNWLYIFVLVASVFVCYWKTFFGELVHDDVFAIKQNPDILPSSSILDVFLHDYWGKPLVSSESHKSYRPLSVLTFRAHFFIHGFKPFGYRLVNVLLHLVVCLLFLHVCQRVLNCSWCFSFCSSLLFAIHPIHAEAVNSVVGRADILACLFFLLAFMTYTHCIRSTAKKLVDQNGNKISSLSKLLKPCWKSLIIFNIVGAAALFAKENGITVFGFCIMYDIMVINECHLVTSCRLTKQVSSKIYNSLLVRIIIITSVASLLLYFRIYLQNGELPQFTAEENPASYSDSCLTRFLTYSYLCFFNAWLLLVPYTLSYDWQMQSIPLVESFLDTRNLLTIGLFLIIFALFVMSSATSILSDQGERKVLLSAILLLTISFLPASNVLFTVGFVVAERILYIPSLGYCLLINFGFAKLAGRSISKDSIDDNTTTRRFKITAVVYTVMMICLSCKTWQQSSVWQHRGTLFKSGVDAVPQNAKAHYNYANYLKDVQRKNEAIHHYQIAVKLSPDHASAHNNLGTLLEDVQESMKHFELAIKNNPQHFNAFLNIGVILSSRGKLNESEAYLKESFRLNPDSSKTLMLLTDVMTKNGHFAEANQLFKDTISSDDNLLLFNNYGLFLSKNDMFSEALIYFNKAHNFSPEHSVPVINKANVYIAMEKFKDAEDTLIKFLKKKKDASVLHHLAALYVKVFKRYYDAEKCWKEALNINPTFTDALFSYVDFLKSQERKEDALVILNNFSKYQPKSSEVLQEMANSLHGMGYLKQALESVENILAMSKEPLVYYQKGNILKDMGLYHKAITAYRNALSLDPKLPEVYVNLGAAHHVLGNLNEAKMYYNYCLTLDPDNKAAKINLGKIKIT